MLLLVSYTVHRHHRPHRHMVGGACWYQLRAIPHSAQRYLVAPAISISSFDGGGVAW